MFYCTGISQDYKSYLILDTDDSCVEKVSLKDLICYVRKGIIISNLNFDGAKFVFSDMTYVNSLMDTFKKKGQTALTKLIVMKKDRPFQVQTLSKLAVSLGLIYDGEILNVDTNTCNVIFPWQHCIYNFSNLGNNSKIESIDVCDPSVVNLSRLGFDAFQYMLLNLGTKASPNYVNLSDCFKELKRFDSYFNESSIVYVGITPNNRMFKVFLSYYQELYSVQFCTVKDIKGKYKKICDLGTTSDDLSYYLYKKINNCSDESIAICKVSKKQFSRKQNPVSSLKKKYSTLQDVYRK